MKKVIIGIAVVLTILAVAVLLMPSEQKPKHVLPEGVVEGEVIRCSATGKVFKIMNGAKRYYSWNAYVRDGKPAYTNKPCPVVSALVEGPDMPE